MGLVVVSHGTVVVGGTPDGDRGICHLTHSVVVAVVAVVAFGDVVVVRAPSGDPGRHEVVDGLGSDRGSCAVRNRYDDCQPAKEEEG